MKKFFFALVSISSFAFSLEQHTIESQPQIRFEHKNLEQSQQERELIFKFNSAVLHMENKKYEKAIALFKESSKLLKVPSYLNIGIAYYKLGSMKNGYLFFNKLYELKELINEDKYSYFSAAFYLYKITKDVNYLNEIVRQSSKAVRLSDNEKFLLTDTYILLENYDQALKTLNAIEGKYDTDLKKALLYIKLRDYTQARVYLDAAYEKNFSDEKRNDILWFRLFRDLKANDLINIKETILKIEKRQKYFTSNKKLPLSIYFNKERFTPKEYFDRVSKVDEPFNQRALFYFAPFIFEDYDAMEEDEKKGFILKSNYNLNELDMMIKYNKDFIKVSKLDPIYKVQVLQEMLDAKYKINAYEYYNLALAYAQVYDYQNAYKYFSKAYASEHGNKLYAVMRLISANIIGVQIEKIEKEFLIKNILSNSGTYQFFGKYIYKIFIDHTIELPSKLLREKQKKSIFFRALYFLENVKKNGIVKNEPLLVEYSKDQLVFMLKLIARDTNESDYRYISRIQDKIPRIFNNDFIKNSLVISDFYSEVLKSLGLYYVTDFYIDGDLSPSYLRTKAIADLYKGKPKNTIDIIDFIQKKYNLNSVDSYYILAAAYLENNQKEFALEILTELEFLHKDHDASFLGGIDLLQDLELNTAPQYFEHKLKGKFIDFKLDNFDQYLENL